MEAQDAIIETLAQRRKKQEVATTVEKIARGATWHVGWWRAPRRRDDLAQDVFVEVLESLVQYDGRGSFGWVRTITVRKCLGYLRSPWRRGLQWVELLVPPEADAAVPVAVVPGTCDALDLERALARLGDTARLVVWLHDVEGYTHGEIGALLGGTASLSKSHLARAHARLRELLEPAGVKTPCMSASTNC